MPGKERAGKMNSSALMNMPEHHARCDEPWRRNKAGSLPATASSRRDAGAPETKKKENEVDENLVF